VTNLNNTLLYPYVLRLTLPDGSTVNFDGFPPESVTPTTERTVNITQRLAGQGVTLLADQPTGLRVVIAGPTDDHTLGYQAGAGRIRALRPGDTVTLTTNLIDRTELQVRENGIIVTPPRLPRLAGGIHDDDEYHSVQNIELFFLPAEDE